MRRLIDFILTFLRRTPAPENDVLPDLTVRVFCCDKCGSTMALRFEQPCLRKRCVGGTMKAAT